MSPRPLAWLTPWLLILPAALASAVLFVAPVGYLAIESLRSFSLSAGPGKDFVLTNYRRLLTDPYYLDVLYRTFELSAAASVICLVLGYPLAMLLRAAPARAKGWLVIGIIAPLLISVIVRTFGWVVILGEFGLLNSALKALGFTGSFSKSSHLFTAWTVVIGLVHVFLPFMVLSIYSALQKQRPGIAQAARSLGASQLRAFWHVTLPLSLPGVVAGVTMVFALSTGAYVTAAVLGGSRVMLMSMLAYQQSIGLSNWPLGAAIGVVLLVGTVLILALFNGLMRRMFPMELAS